MRMQLETTSQGETDPSATAVFSECHFTVSNTDIAQREVGNRRDIPGYKEL